MDSPKQFRHIFRGLMIVAVLAMGTLCASQEPDSETRPQQSDQPDFSLIKECRSVFKNEVQPLQALISKKSTQLQYQRSIETQFVASLESANDKSLAKVRKEMQELADRLAMLERLENVLADMDPDAIQNAIGDGQKKLNLLDARRKELSKRQQLELADVQLEYSQKNEALAETASQFFRKKGSGDFKGLNWKYGNANFAYATFTCGYDTKNKNSNFTISLNFAPPIKLEDREYEKLDDTYPIYQWTDRNLAVLVNGLLINAYDSHNKLDKQKLMQALKHFVDFEKLALVGE